MVREVYHGTYEAFPIIKAGSWVTNSLQEAAWYARLRSYDRGVETPVICRFILSDIRLEEPLLTTLPGCLNGVLSQDTVPEIYLNFEEVVNTFPMEERRIYYPAEIIDITHLIK